MQHTKQGTSHGRAATHQQLNLLLDGCPIHDVMDLHGYVDSDWATCPKTHWSFTGVCVRLAGGTIAYKSKLQLTVAQSSAEAEFMGASDFGRVLLFVTIFCGGVLGRIFVSRSSYCRPYLERIYLQGQFWRAKFPSKTTCKIMIQWPFFSSRTTINTNISPTVCSPVELFRRGTRKTFLLL
jgi:hypothetical protein